MITHAQWGFDGIPCIYMRMYVCVCKCLKFRAIIPFLDSSFAAVCRFFFLPFRVSLSLSSRPVKDTTIVDLLSPVVPIRLAPLAGHWQMPPREDPHSRVDSDVDCSKYHSNAGKSYHVHVVQCPKSGECVHDFMDRRQQYQHGCTSRCPAQISAIDSK